jgi:hypothetical protein
MDRGISSSRVGYEPKFKFGRLPVSPAALAGRGGDATDRLVVIGVSLLDDIDEALAANET